MFKGINIHETKQITLKSDPDPANPTVFHIGALDQIISGYIEDQSTVIDFVPLEVADRGVTEAEKKAGQAVQLRIQHGRRNMLMIKFGVRKIENYFDPAEDKAMTVEAKPVKIYDGEYLALPDGVIRGMQLREGITELIKEIGKLNGLTEDEAKN